MPTDSEILENQIYLGGQISNQYAIFKEIARMSPDWAEIYEILKKMPEWEKEPDEDKVVLEMVELFGEIDFVRNCTELTILSMIMGDTRGRYKVGGTADKSRTIGPNPST